MRKRLRQNESITEPVSRKPTQQAGTLKTSKRGANVAFAGLDDLDAGSLRYMGFAVGSEHAQRDGTSLSDHASSDICPGSEPQVGAGGKRSRPMHGLDFRCGEIDPLQVMPPLHMVCIANSTQDVDPPKLASEMAHGMGGQGLGSLWLRCYTSHFAPSNSGVGSIRDTRKTSWLPGSRPQEPFEGVPLDRVKVGFVEGEYRAGPCH